MGRAAFGLLGVLGLAGLLAGADGFLARTLPPPQRRAAASASSVLRMSGSGKVGKILGPGPAGAWDDYKVSGPVVRADPNGQGWNLFYYGRSLAFNQTADLSTWVGMWVWVGGCPCRVLCRASGQLGPFNI